MDQVRLLALQQFVEAALGLGILDALHQRPVRVVLDQLPGADLAHTPGLQGMLRQTGAADGVGDHGVVAGRSEPAG